MKVSSQLLKNKEELTAEEATLVTVQNIKTKQDLEELLENRTEYEAAGVNIQAILDHYIGSEELPDAWPKIVATLKLYPTGI